MISEMIFPGRQLQNGAFLEQSVSKCALSPRCLPKIAEIYKAEILFIRIA